MRSSIFYYLLLLAASVSPTSGAGVEREFIERQWTGNGNTTQSPGRSMSLRALFALESRQSDDCAPCANSPERCCRNGRDCCPAPNDHCVKPGGVCCGDSGTCGPGEKCCKPDGCMPKDATCCGNGQHCKAGRKCTDTGCAPDDDEDEDEGDDSLTSTGEGKTAEYTFTAEWRYWSYFYTTFLGSVTISTQIDTSSFVPVTATAAFDAYNQYSSITETMSFPTPPEATQTPPMPSEEESPATDSTTDSTTDAPDPTESPGAASLVAHPLSGRFAIFAVVLGAVVPGLLAFAI